MPLTVITQEQFADKTWRRASSYAFAAPSNILPVVLSELAKLVPAMPLGFVKAGDQFQLVAITSLQPGSNLFVAPDGKWIGEYIPSFLQTYPFRLVKSQEREENVLCFDTDSGLLNSDGEGEAFFDGSEPSTIIKTLLGVLSEYESGRIVTQRLVDALQVAELIQPWPLNLQQGEQTLPVEGLFRIDEAALNALPDDEILTLRQAGALPLTYAQLFSTNQLAMLSKAAEIQARIREQLKNLAGSQVQSVVDSGFRMSADETFKF